MKPTITMILGAACLPEKVKPEQDRFDARREALIASGAEVVVIGTSKDGFSLRDLEQKLAPRQCKTAIIFEAHGDIDPRNNQHVIRIDDHPSIPSNIFYACLARRLGGQPANVFMQSCGSGNGLEDGIALLPPNSTIFNLVAPKSIESYELSSKGYSVQSTATDCPAEALFLNMLCHGLDDALDYSPTLTTKPDDIITINELWDEASSICGEWAEVRDGFPQPYMDDAVKFLANHTTETTAATALATMEYYRSNMALMNPAPRAKSPLVPFEAVFSINEEQFRDDVATHGLLGPIATIAYAYWRDRLGAFQRPVTATCG